MSALDEFNSSELIKTRTRYSFSSEKLVTLANSMNRLSKTVQTNDVELIATEYGINIISFLHSDLIL